MSVEMNSSSHIPRLALITFWSILLLSAPLACRRHDNGAKPAGTSGRSVRQRTEEQPSDADPQADWVGMPETEKGPLPTETELFRAPKEEVVRWAAMCPKKKSLAVITGRGEKFRVSLNGSQVPGEWDGVHDIWFSSDGSSLAFDARIGDQECVIRDGQRVGELYDEVRHLQFLPDGDSVLFVAKEEDKEFLVREGEHIYGVYSAVSRPRFAGGDSVIIFSAMSDNKERIVANGRPLTDGYRHVAVQHVSSDGQSLVYTATLPSGNVVLMRDGKRVSQEFWSILYGESASGHTSYFVGITDPSKQERVTVKIRRGTERTVRQYREVTWPTISPDGRSVAYGATHGGKWFIVRDGAILGRGFDDVEPGLVFSPDASSFAVRVTINDHEFMTKNGKVLGPPCWSIIGPKWSAEGDALVWSARQDDGWVVMLDGNQAGPKYPALPMIVFGPQAGDLAVAVRDPQTGKRVLFQNGKRIATYDNAWHEQDDAGRLAFFLAARGNVLYRVDLNW